MKVQANDIQMNYELTGKKDASVVMLSHALGSSLSMWDPQMEILESRYRVLRYDTRGHGGADAPANAYTMELLGDDAVRLMDALEIAKVHWVGLSMGGMVGQSIALNHSDRLLSLALCDTTAVVPREAQTLWQERIEAARSRGMQTLVEGALDRWFTSGYRSGNHLELELIRRVFLATPVDGFVGCSEAIRRLAYLDRLSEITTPTLIVVGADDPGTPVAASEAMHERIPDSILVVLPSAAHLSNIEQAGAFNTTLMDFLREHGSTVA
ncbi:MAG: 3-oxoadipate enol-lactonase [Deltaproteobacteria bacterium]|nr:3-oxoadipate enol-lactonase [Deltaproteobacteria bacterium]